MIEYGSKAGKVIVCKAKDLRIREVLINQNTDLWHKISPDSYIVKIQLEKSVYMLNKKDTPELTENKNATFYDIAGDNDIEALKKVQKSVTTCKDIVYHQAFLEIVNEVLEKGK